MSATTHTPLTDSGVLQDFVGFRLGSEPPTATANYAEQDDMDLCWAVHDCATGDPDFRNWLVDQVATHGQDIPASVANMGPTIEDLRLVFDLTHNRVNFLPLINPDGGAEL